MLSIRDLILGMSTALGVGLATAMTLSFVASGSPGDRAGARRVRRGDRHGTGDKGVTKR
jgi:hypothetical protein